MENRVLYWEISKLHFCWLVALGLGVVKDNDVPLLVKKEDLVNLFYY